MSFRRVVALAGLLAAFSVHAETAGHALVGDAKAGETKAAACGACHGPDGNSSDKQYPKIAGQQADYIARQLALFKSNKRVNPVMAGFAAPLSEQDMADLGAYFASKRAVPGNGDQALKARGEQLWRTGDTALGVPACMACHGPAGRGNSGAGYAQLSGQWTDYVVAKLKEWKSGTTWGTDDRALIMPDIAKRLSEQDINAVASYAEGLHTVEHADAAPAGHADAKH
ncbi:c-type cytochrome [Tahibacter amnicola]|uniref:Cytochrome c4 n=1 Tax=Tahibacter amnicola TaxID=2976241 RepID=A0ABY6BFZ6_9GAMM|nr:cytochrome c4 [Tahibacter amnicola]UXI68203.1 cytochrome c4 [Tahibacter amnicola]